MLSGEFVELKSIEPVQEEETLTDRTFVSDEPTPEQKSEPKQQALQVVVKTPDFEVTGDTSDGEIDMTITAKE